MKHLNFRMLILAVSPHFFSVLLFVVTRFPNNIGESERIDNDSDSEMNVGENTDARSDDMDTKSNDLRDLEGRRIIDVAYLFAQIRGLNTHGSTTCNFSNMEFLKETRLGLKSIFHFQCTQCGICKTITSVNESNSLEINYALVLGSYAVGIGCYQSEEFLANMEVPFMSSSTYDKNQKILQQDLKVCAKIEMEKAIEEEKVFARLKGCIDGTYTLLTVLADGCWSKRSYRANFSSKSGTASHWFRNQKSDMEPCKK